jgi:type II secretory pathway pseudopilin PulG
VAQPMGRCRTRPTARRSERGYILLMLMLFVALLAIAATALAPSIAFQVRRDREEEMIHRGTQYSRAIRRYVKKTGRYPSRLEELENTNNIRFLRKRYKDPITNKDFKLLHVGEVQLTGIAGVAGATLGGGSIPGASAAGAIVQTASPMGGAGARSMLGGPATQPAPGAPAATGGAGDDSGPEAGQPREAGQPKNDLSQGDASQAASGPSGSSDKLSSQVFGGGPIVGVASISKAQSIREFNHKNHYDKWQFIYDPTMDRGGLITTPAQPALQVAAPIQQNSSSPGIGQNPLGTNPPPGQQSPPPAQPTQQQQQ